MKKAVIMASPEFTDKPEPKTLEDALEWNVPFKNERIARTLGRVSWLSTRQGMELLFTLANNGFNSQQLVTIYGAFKKFNEDWQDLIDAGVETPEYPSFDEGDTHPQEAVYRLYCEATTDHWDEAATDTTKPFDQGPADKIYSAMLEAGSMTGEELYEYLKQSVEQVQTEPTRKENPEL